MLIAIHLNPSNARAHMELGNALEILGEREKAMAELQKALQLDQSLGLAKQKLEELQAKN